MYHSCKDLNFKRYSISMSSEPRCCLDGNYVVSVLRKIHVSVGITHIPYYCESVMFKDLQCSCKLTDRNCLQAKGAPVYNITVNASLQRPQYQEAAPEAEHLSSAVPDLMLDMSATSIPQQEAAKQVHACHLHRHVFCLTIASG